MALPKHKLLAAKVRASMCFKTALRYVLRVLANFREALEKRVCVFIVCGRTVASKRNDGLGRLGNVPKVAADRETSHMRTKAIRGLQLAASIGWPCLLRKGMKLGD